MPSTAFIFHPLSLSQPLPSCRAAWVTLHVLLWVSVSSVWSHVCLVQFSLQFLPVCLFVDEGAEDQVGPLHRFPSHEPASSGERRRLLAPSISVSVPDEEPYSSDQEYYEHPLFSSEWTSVLPRVTAQSAEGHLDQEKGEQEHGALWLLLPACSSVHTHHVQCAFVWVVGGHKLVLSTWKGSP